MNDTEKDGIILALERLIRKIKADDIDVLEITTDVKLVPINDGFFALAYRDLYKTLTIKYTEKQF